MGTKIQSVYVEELGEYVEIAVVEEEKKVYEVNVDVKEYTEYEFIKKKRQDVFDKYGVVYGKKMFKFEKQFNVIEEEFELMCKYISRGYSKKDALSMSRFETKYEIKSYTLEPSEFIRFTTVCKYLKPCYVDGMVEETCRHKENIPTGSSWGECSSHCCPIYKK